MYLHFQCGPSRVNHPVCDQCLRLQQGRCNKQCIGCLRCCPQKACYFCKARIRKKFCEIELGWSKNRKNIQHSLMTQGSKEGQIVCFRGKKSASLHTCIMRWSQSTQTFRPWVFHLCAWRRHIQESPAKDETFYMILYTANCCRPAAVVLKLV